jgi:hypothetical protein
VTNGVSDLVKRDVKVVLCEIIADILVGIADFVESTNLKALVLRELLLSLK